MAVSVEIRQHEESTAILLKGQRKGSFCVTDLTRRPTLHAKYSAHATLTARKGSYDPETIDDNHKISSKLTAGSLEEMDP